MADVIKGFIQKLFFESIENGELSGVQKALREGADVHENDDWAICLASKSGNKEVVELLLTFGMDVKNRYNTPLRNAAEDGQHEIVKLLLDNGADDTALAEHLQWKYADEILGIGTIARMQGVEPPPTKEEIVKTQQETKKIKKQQFRQYVKRNRLGL